MSSKKQTEPQTEPQTKPQTEPQTTVKARVLAAGVWGRPDDVVDVPAGTQSPDLDTHPDAVAYAESLKD